MQVAAIVGHELLNARRRDLREQIADFLIVAARAQRLHDFPVIAFFSQFHFAGGGLHAARAKPAPSSDRSISGRENLPVFSRYRSGLICARE